MYNRMGKQRINSMKVLLSLPFIISTVNENEKSQTHNFKGKQFRTLPKDSFLLQKVTSFCQRSLLLAKDHFLLPNVTSSAKGHFLLPKITSSAKGHFLLPKILPSTAFSSPRVGASTSMENTKESKNDNTVTAR